MDELEAEAEASTFSFQVHIPFWGNDFAPLFRRRTWEYDPCEAFAEIDPVQRTITADVNMDWTGEFIPRRVWNSEVRRVRIPATLKSEALQPVLEQIRDVAEPASQGYHFDWDGGKGVWPCWTQDVERHFDLMHDQLELNESINVPQISVCDYLSGQRLWEMLKLFRLGYDIEVLAQEVEAEAEQKKIILNGHVAGYFEIYLRSLLKSYTPEVP